MANYASANLTKAQTLLSQMFNAGEKAFRQPVVFNEFRKSAEIMIPSHNIVRTREDRPVEVNYLKRTARSLGTGGRLHNHTGAKGDSGIITPSWQAYDDKFKYSLKQGDTNVYDLDMQIANELSNVIANFAEGLESAATTFLHTERSGVNAYDRQGKFNGSTDVFEILAAAESRAVQITKTMMDFNKFQGMGYVVFCDSVAYDKFESYANQGTGNSTNTSFQFSGVTFVKAFDLDALAVALGYTQGYWITAPVGTFAVLDWIPKQNREGIETKVNAYGSLLNPVDGLIYATHEYEERADDSDNNGYSQDVVKQVQVSVDLAFESAPLSVANKSVFKAGAIVTAYSS